MEGEVGREEGIGMEVGVVKYGRRRGEGGKGRDGW